MPGKKLRVRARASITTSVVKVISVGVVVYALVASASLAQAQPAGERDPRNWPTLTRFVADRYENAGRVVTLRVYARPSSYYNCGYRHAKGVLSSFALMAGPLEVVTGYIPRELGRLLRQQLEEDPWAPITVQVRYDPQKVNDMCPRQVDILAWSKGWQYPQGSFTPVRPEPSLQPTAKDFAHLKQRVLWDMLRGREPKRVPEGTRLIQIGDSVELTGGARLTAAYHCAFKGAARTHYAIQINNGKKRLKRDFVVAYVPRSPAARQLVDYISLHRLVALTVKAKVVKQAMSHYCPFQLEVSGWSFPSLTQPADAAASGPQPDSSRLPP